VLVVAAGTAIAVIGYQRLGTSKVAGSLAGYQVIDDETVSVTISVTRSDRRGRWTASCGFGPRTAARQAGGRVLVPRRTRRTVQVTTTLKSSKPPVMADVYGCGTDVPGYLRSP